MANPGKKQDPTSKITRREKIKPGGMAQAVDNLPKHEVLNSNSST
jgi:hypothetical protein